MAIETSPVIETLAPLRDGERITRDEFDRRYAAFTEPRKAELIEGVVYVASPVSLAHGEPHGLLATCLGLYYLQTPGVFGADNSTVYLGERDVPQPDLLVRIGPEQGGQSKPTSDGYLAGPPELVCEIAVSRLAVDRGPRLRAYQAAGVREYLLWAAPDETLEWYVLRNGLFTLLLPGEDGIVRSEVFPGLWLDPAALLRDDREAILRPVQAGLASPEHADFVRRLAQTAASQPGT